MEHLSGLRADECLEDVVVQIQRVGDKTVEDSNCEGHLIEGRCSMADSCCQKLNMFQRGRKWGISSAFSLAVTTI